MAYMTPVSEPMAIIGTGCRFAGDVDSPSALWKLLEEPTDLSKHVPADRFNIQAFHHPDGEYHGTTNAPKSYWLQGNHKTFDAAFFNITPKEAEAIDPQQRMLLEVVYEALESSGYTLADYSGKNVAVFAGLMTADYDTVSLRDELFASQYFATGNARSIVSNRISYFFNFNGPSMTIDTACSSSLVALHQAVLSLRSGEAEMACVAGVNLMLVPEQFIVESSLHMLSPTGKCRMWDESADGYARGEGVAAVFIKPLSRALADGDHIEAIIRETGVNSDGRSRGITMPNSDAQAQLIRDTYRRSGLNPGLASDRCQYFEAHGTGTQAGDPNEARAIDAAFFRPLACDAPPGEDDGAPGSASMREHPPTADTSKMLVGSLKTVIGHTEGAAGLAGMLKVVQSLNRGLVPGNLHLDKVNPLVSPYLANLQVPTGTVAWPSPHPGQPRRGSVNSFGFGGTNSHAILEQYLPAVHDEVALSFSPRLSHSARLLPVVDAKPSPLRLPLTLSANSQESLLGLAERYRKFLADDPSVGLNALAWHTYARRTTLPWKLAVSASSTDELIAKLDVLVESSDSAPKPGTIGTRSKASHEKPKILGIFTGQGAQWATMSRGLLLSSKTFAATIECLNAVLRGCPNPPSWSLRQQILAEPEHSSVNEALVSQPLCTALQIALVDTLRVVGVTFDTVVGHSSGEIAAAYASGRLSARDAMLISYYRGYYAHLAAGPDGQKGGMLAVGLSREEAEALCGTEPYRGHVCVAASNAPGSITLSGNLEKLEKVRHELLAQNMFARSLQVDTAYHSRHMDAPSSRYLDALAACGVSATAEGNGTRWISSVMGFGTASQDHLRSTYWKDNMVQPVLFQEALGAALESRSFDCAIEVGPHPALKGPVLQTVKAKTDQVLLYSGLLDRKKEDNLAFSEFLGWMWTHFGSSSSQIRAYVANSSQPELAASRLHGLPAYAWDHSSEYYRESRIAKQYHFKTGAPHELLGVRTRDDNEFQLRWRNILKMEHLPWTKGHVFQGQALLPASAYCVMAYDAARALLAGRAATMIEIRDLAFMHGITIESDGPGVEVLFSMTVEPEPKHRGVQETIDASFTITSAIANGSTSMTKNFSGKLHVVLGEPNAKVLPTRPASRPETMTVSVDGFYDMMLETGLEYTGPFSGLKHLERRFNFASGLVTKLHPEDGTSLRVSPATLDSCFQTAFVTYSSPGDKALWTSFLPKTIERVRFNTAVCEIGDKGDHVLAVDTYLTRAKPISHDAAALFTVDILIFGQEGDMEIQVEGLTVASFSPTRPEDDHELYLTTVMDVDPEEAIVSLPKRLVPPSSVVLLESCERVASFYRGKALDSALLARASPLSLSLTPATSPRSSMASSMTAAESMTDEGFSSANPWPSETEESIDCFIRSSPWFTTLDFVRTLSKNLPDLLATMLPTVISEASYVHAFREHVARICRQIVHKYPGVHVLGLTDPRHSLTEHVIDAMKDSLGAYRVGSEPEANLMDRLPDQTVLRQKVFTQPLHLRGGVDESERTAPYDVVILSSSVIRDEDMHRTLKEIHSLMRPGGFLLLVQSPGTSLERRLATCGRMGSDSPGLATPPDWPDLLEDCGFANNIKNADQYDASGFSIAVRQRKSAYKNLFLNPSQHQASKRLTTKLVVVGGSTEHVGTLAACVAQQLHERCGRVELVQDLDAIDPADIASYSAVIFLADLDRPVLSNMNQARLDTLRSLLRPEMVMLWVTHDARSGNAEHAASFGFCRTMLAELPSLVLQNLDLESLATDWASDMITQTFARLALHARMEKAGGKKDSLWAYEPEIYTEHGQRLVPRVLPWKAANDRVNRPRRVIEYEVNTKERIVDIVPANGADGFRKHGTRVGSLPACADASSGDDFVEALYSCANAINSCHVVVGRGRRSGRVQVTLSRTNASYVSALSPFLALAQEDCGDVALLAAYLVRLLTVMAFADHAKDKSAVLLVEPDGMLYECARRVLSARGLVVQAYTARQEKQAKYPEMHYVQPWSSARELRDMLPVDGAEVLDLAEEASELSRTLRTKMPSNCEYRHHGDFAKHQRVLTEKAWNTAVRLATEMASASESSSDEAGLMSVDDWLQSAAHSEPFPLLDWRANRTVFHGVKPLAGERLLRPNRTYVLVGLTRDFGQSLCDLLVSQGARHIVLTSRNPPNRRPNWAEALQRKHGVQIRIEPMDVTMLDHVVAFKQRLAESGLPAVGGLVNGAMVLEDKVFSQMTAETLHRVLRPKTVGSANLDRVFDDADMDFFIMTSSFAAIGGHAGQSNYAAANMFMNGLAASRRRRGLPGSALNIGVIYGLGFLHREKEDLYQGLEREGYPPISERDLHHMFVEAMVAGRPAGGGGGGGDGAEPPVADITTGLRRFHAGSATPLHWHRDPRFSHYTAAAGDEDGLATGGGREKKQTVRDRLEGAATRDAMLAVLAPGFAHHLEALLQMPGGSVGGDVSIADLGVDSLVAVDIRAWIWKMTARDVAVMKVLGRDSIAKLCEEIVDGMLADREAAKAAG